MDLVKKLAAKKVLDENIVIFGESALSEHTFNKTPKFHEEIYSLITQDCSYIALAAPRGFAKSTTVSLVYVLWAALTGKSRFIVIISDTYSQSKLFLETIKRELESNEFIKLMYGKQQTEKWSEGEIELALGCKILAKGQGMKMRGLKYGNTRPDLVVLDDLENSELVESKDRRDKLERWFNAEVLPSLAQNPKVIYVGTILHDDSLLKKVIDNYTGWEKRLYKAIQDDGTSLWPERLSIEDLNNIKAQYIEKGQLDLFYSEYMNEPVNDTLREFKTDWLKYCREDQVPSNLRIITTCDPAISEKDTADYTAIVTTGIAPDSSIYVLDVVRKRMNPTELINTLFERHYMFDSEIVAIESVAFQQVFSHLLKIEMQKRQQFMNLKEVKTLVDKNIKIRGLIPYYQNGKIYHVGDTATALESELFVFPKGKHDDVIDALSMTIQFWKSPLFSSPPNPMAKAKTRKQIMQEEGLLK